MYHFENGYHAEVKCETVDGKTVCVIEVTGNSTHAKIVRLSTCEVADTLIRIRDMRHS